MPDIRLEHEPADHRYGVIGVRPDQIPRDRLVDLDGGDVAVSPEYVDDVSFRNQPDLGAIPRNNADNRSPPPSPMEGEYGATRLIVPPMAPPSAVSKDPKSRSVDRVP